MFGLDSEVNMGGSQGGEVLLDVRAVVDVVNNFADLDEQLFSVSDSVGRVLDVIGGVQTVGILEHGL